MKRVILIVVVLILLGGGGGAGWWFFLREPPTEDAAEAATPAVPDAIDTQRALDLDPFVMPVLRNGRVIQHVTVLLRVEFAAPESDDWAEESTPRLRDAFLRELHGLFAFRHIQVQGEALPVVRQRLTAVANRVLGDGRVKAVLVKGASRRDPNEG